MITLTEQQDTWIKSQIAAGRYTNDSEYVRDLIRKDENNAAHDELIRATLVVGENSGTSRAMDRDEFKRRMSARNATRTV